MYELKKPGAAGSRRKWTTKEYSRAEESRSTASARFRRSG